MTHGATQTQIAKKLGSEVNMKISEEQIFVFKKTRTAYYRNGLYKINNNN